MAEDEFIDTEITDWAAHHLSVGQAKLEAGPISSGAEMLQAHGTGVSAEFLGSIAVSLYQIGATLAAMEQRATEEAEHPLRTVSRDDLTETPTSTRDWLTALMGRISLHSEEVAVNKDTLANLMAFADPAARQRLADALAEEPEDVDYVRDLVSEWHSELTPDQYLRSIPGSSGLGRSEGYVSREMQPIFCDWVLDRIIHADTEPVDEDNEPEDTDEEPFPGEDSEPLDGWSNGHPV